MDGRQSAKTVTERRKYPRIKTKNDVSYILLNAKRDVIDQGEGKALDLSQSGTLLETIKPLNGPFVILVTIDLEGKKVKVRGRIANTRRSANPGCYLTGIEFEGSREEQMEAIVAFVKVYNHRKQRDGNRNLYSISS